MSRSYRKNTFVVDRHGRNIRRKFFKRYHNKSLRNLLKNVDYSVNNSSHKKYTDSWGICDYRWYWSKKDAISEYYNMIHNEHINPVRYSWFFRKYPTLKSWLKNYNKQVIYK